MTAFGSGFIPLVAGLEAAWGRTTDYSLVAELISLSVLLTGCAMATKGLVENRFFSGVVRIQVDRGHHVVSMGPSRWIRHTGYAGTILWFLGTPDFLDSPWAFVPAALCTVLLVVRTQLEDKALQRLLDGCRAYATRVRFRLVPGIW